MAYTHDQLMAMKRENPRAYYAALAELEADKVGTRQYYTADDYGPADAEPGAPTQLAGVKPYSTDQKSIIRRPTYASSVNNDAIDNALDYSPDPHFAAHAAKALGLQGWTLSVFALGPDGPTDTPDDEAKAELERFAARVARHYGGGIDAILQVGLDSVLRRGAVAIELDISDGSDDVLDVDLVDPTVVDFRVETDGPHRSIVPVYRPPSGDPVPLNAETFCYIGANTGVGRPHGQSPFLPLVDTTYPQARLRDNLTRVADQQGFSRMAFTIDTDRLMAGAPPDVVERLSDGTFKIKDWNAYKSFYENVRGDIEDLVQRIYADDVWVMGDTVKPDSVGANHAQQSLKPLEIAQVFDQDQIVATLGQPAIHGRNWGAALSTTGSVQWLVYSLGLEGLRAVPRRAVEWMLNQYLRIRGIRAYAVLGFDEIRKTDALAEAQADQVRTETIARQLELGVIDLDEAAETLTGHDAPEGAAPSGVVDDGGRLHVAARDGGSGRSNGRDGAGSGHSNGHGPCTCAECTDEVWSRDPFEPDSDDGAESPIELVGGAGVDEDDVRQQRGRYDRWARRSAPLFAGLLASRIYTGGRVPRGWVWTPDTAAYHYPTSVAGRLGSRLPEDKLRELFAKRLASHQEAVRGVTDRLIGGDMTTREWQKAIADSMRQAHIEGRMFGVGGQWGMGPEDIDAVVARLHDQYRYLGDFGQQIARGELSEAQIRARIAQYVESPPRETFRRASEAVHRVAGYDQERNVLGVVQTEHCQDCELEAARGWVPLGEIKIIGERQCRGNCKCEIEYRKAPLVEAEMSPYDYARALL